jgi:uncharacterized protein involved in cysteine biosynthesis
MRPNLLEIALSPIASIGFLFLRPRLWRFLLAPVAINMVLAALVSWWAVRRGYPSFRERIDSLFAETWLGEKLAAAGAIGATAATLVAGLFIVYVLATLIAAPFSDKLGEHIERELLAEHPDLMAPDLPWWKGVAFAIRDTGQRLLCTAPLFLLSFLVGLVPVVGPPVSFLIVYSTAVFFLTMDSFGVPLDRRFTPFRVKAEWLRERAWLTLPLGATLALIGPALLFCAPLVLPPLAATSATRLYCRYAIAEKRSRTAG